MAPRTRKSSATVKARTPRKGGKKAVPAARTPRKPVRKATPRTPAPRKAATAKPSAQPTPGPGIVRGAPVSSTAGAPSSRAPKTGPGPVLAAGVEVIAHPEISAAATRWALVTARDLMRENVVTVSKDTPLSELERILSDQKITGAPVTDESGAIVGVVSVRDLIDRYSEDSDAKPRRGHGWFELSSEELLDQDFESFEVPEEAEETVADIMTADVVSVPEDAGIREIAKTMTERKVHRVLVERAGRAGVHIGIVGTFEILDMLAE